MSNVSDEVIKKVLFSFSTNKLVGMEQNPAKLLKEDAEVLAFPLSNIKKLSIKLSAISDDYKIAKSNAVFKNDSS